MQNIDLLKILAIIFDKVLIISEILKVYILIYELLKVKISATGPMPAENYVFRIGEINGVRQKGVCCNPPAWSFCGRLVTSPHNFHHVTGKDEHKQIN
jgi:hypothetical protein